MNAAEKFQVERDIYQIVVGDLREMNPMMRHILPMKDRQCTAIQYIASERTLSELIATISVLTFDRDFSLDVAVLNDSMVTIGLTIYDEPTISIEGLT